MSTRDARAAARTQIVDAPTSSSLKEAKKAAARTQIVDAPPTSSLKEAKKAAARTQIVDAPTSSLKAKKASTLEETGAVSSLKSIIYAGERERQLVILPYGIRDAYWQNSNITYFCSSGTSNEGCGWLCGTFFPTGGITTKIVEKKNSRYRPNMRRNSRAST